MLEEHQEILGALSNAAYRSGNIVLRDSIIGEVSKPQADPIKKATTLESLSSAIEVVLTVSPDKYLGGNITRDKATQLQRAIRNEIGIATGNPYNSYYPGVEDGAPLFTLMGHSAGDLAKRFPEGSQLNKDIGELAGILHAAGQRKITTETAMSLEKDLWVKITKALPTTGQHKDAVRSFVNLSHNVVLSQKGLGRSQEEIYRDVGDIKTPPILFCNKTTTNGVSLTGASTFDDFRDLPNEISWAQGAIDRISRDVRDMHNKSLYDFVIARGTRVMIGNGGLEFKTKTAAQATLKGDPLPTLGPVYYNGQGYKDYVQSPDLEKFTNFRFVGNVTTHEFGHNLDFDPAVGETSFHSEANIFKLALVYDQRIRPSGVGVAIEAVIGKGDYDNHEFPQEAFARTVEYYYGHEDNNQASLLQSYVTHIAQFHIDTELSHTPEAEKAEKVDILKEIIREPRAKFFGEEVAARLDSITSKIEELNSGIEGGNKGLTGERDRLVQEVQGIVEKSLARVPERVVATYKSRHGELVATSLGSPAEQVGKLLNDLGTLGVTPQDSAANPSPPQLPGKTDKPLQ